MMDFLLKKINMKYSLILVIFFILGNIDIYSQIKGEELPSFNPDTVFIFKPSKPLLNIIAMDQPFKKAWGVDLLFSESGFGAGTFYQLIFSKHWLGFISLYITGVRNTDEFDAWDYEEGVWRVPNKVNRVYQMPLTIGFQRNIFTEELSESFKPYISFGFGPSFIFTTPYSQEFFTAFKYTQAYTRFSSFLGFGTEFNAKGKYLMNLNIRYYYIPFGGKGIESIKDMPMTNMGGIFLSLSLGSRW